MDFHNEYSVSKLEIVRRSLNYRLLVVRSHSIYIKKKTNLTEIIGFVWARLQLHHPTLPESERILDCSGNLFGVTALISVYWLELVWIKHVDSGKLWNGR